MNAPAPAAVVSSQHEFSDTENAVIRHAASRSKLWGTVSIILAVLSLPMALVMLTKGMLGITLLMSAVVGIVTGVTILGIGKALNDVVETKGNDVALMMAALQKLSTAYTIQLIASAIGFVIGFIGGAAGMKF